MRIAGIGVLTLYIGIGLFSVYAAPGELDLTFNAGSGIDKEVYSIAPLPDGKVVIGGFFKNVRGGARSGIARLNADGSADTSFVPPAYEDRYVYSISVLTTGAMLIGGFDSQSSFIRRLNENGSVDFRFSLGSEWGTQVRTFAVQTDGKVIIGGGFYKVAGARRNRVARLNEDGTLDTSFDAGMLFDNEVRNVWIQPDGRIIVGGDFAGRLKRLEPNGAQDTSFNIGSGIEGDSRTLSFDDQGNIVIGGYILSVQGQPRQHVARLKNDGTVDATFAADLTLDSYVQVVRCVGDGKVLIGGQFTQVNGVKRPGIARLNSDGTLDQTFASPFSPDGYAGEVDAITVDSSGKILVGGGLAWPTSSYVARLNSDGSVDGSFAPNDPIANAWVPAIDVQPDGKTIAAVANVGSARIERFNDDGTVDESFAPSTMTGDLTCLKRGEDGKTLAASLHFSGSLVTSDLVRLNVDGNLDPSFTAPTINNSINAVAGQLDGKILIAGFFDHVDGKPRNRVARLNANGSLDESFDPSSAFPNMIVGEDPALCVAVQADAKILVGFRLTGCGCTRPTAIVRLESDGTLDQTFNTTNVIASEFDCITVQSDRKILAGGFQISERESTANHNGILRFNEDGSVDHTFVTSLEIGATVQQIAIEQSGKILLNYSKVVRLNTNGTVDSSFIAAAGTGFQPYLSDMKLQSDGNIIVAGSFSAINGESRARIARLFGSPVPIPIIAQADAGGVAMRWTNPQMHLQSASTVGGPYVDVTDAKSPWKPPTPLTAPIFYRLRSN